MACSRLGKPTSTASPVPAVSDGVAQARNSTSSARSRTRRSSPHRRSSSIVPVLAALARGRGDGDVRRSTTSVLTPCSPSVTAAASPPGPAPTIATSNWRVSMWCFLSTDTMSRQYTNSPDTMSDEVDCADGHAPVRAASPRRGGRAHADADHRSRLRAPARGARRAGGDRPRRAQGGGCAIHRLRDLRHTRGAVRRGRPRAGSAVGLRASWSTPSTSRTRAPAYAPGSGRRPRCSPRTARSTARCGRWPSSTRPRSGGWWAAWMPSGRPG